ncbi:GFA family protein [Aestuariibacter halophilus]|uniref:GFA family protein n=1 Tax=Fluctibacter halophilus TaxID=226011 RepID=A0ABS8GD66_9ALTE|nr:GFA family protein [Aestuariibacter halophilus]MCC2618318.1 GFA family protein [Aestuariibacter halophilus]
MGKVVNGQCLCGQVKVCVSGPISSIIHCHCSLCRKSSGTAYATNGFVARKDVQFLHGDNDLGCYSLRPGKQRYFCKTCASPLYSENSADPARIRLRLGILDDPIEARPMSHNFVSSRADWDDLDADLPRYDAHEPGRENVAAYTKP